MSHTVMRDPKGVISERFKKESTGIRWRSKQERKKKVFSRTAGRTKSLQCQATSLQRFCAKYARARKIKEYASVMKTLS